MELPFFKKKDPVKRHYDQVVKDTSKGDSKKYTWPQFVKAFEFDRTPSDKKGQLFKMIMSSRKNFI